MRIQIIGFLIGMQALSVNSFAGGHKNTLGKGAFSSSTESVSLQPMRPKGNAPGTERDDASELGGSSPQASLTEVGSRADDGAPMKQKGQAVITISNMDLQKPAGLGAEVCFANANGGVVTAADIASGALEGQTLNWLGSASGIGGSCVVASDSETNDVANRSVNPKIPSVSFAQAIPGTKVFGCKPTVTTDIAAFGATDPDYYYVPAGQDLAFLQQGRTAFVPPLVLFTVGGAAGNQADAQENQVASNENVEKQNYIAQNGRPDQARGISSRGRGRGLASLGTPTPVLPKGESSNPNEKRCASVVGGGGSGGGGGGGQGGQQQAQPGGALNSGLGG